MDFEQGWQHLVVKLSRQHEPLVPPLLDDLRFDLPERVILILQASVCPLEHVPLMKGLASQCYRGGKRQNSSDPPPNVGRGHEHAEESEAQSKRPRSCELSQAACRRATSASGLPLLIRQ